MKSFFKKKQDLSTSMIDRLKFCVGAEPYQGADDVTYCIYAMLICCKAYDRKKNLSSLEKELYGKWVQLIGKNMKFMEDMEVLNEDIF